MAKHSQVPHPHPELETETPAFAEGLDIELFDQLDRTATYDQLVEFLRHNRVLGDRAIRHAQAVLGNGLVSAALDELADQPGPPTGRKISDARLYQDPDAAQLAILIRTFDGNRNFLIRDAEHILGPDLVKEALALVDKDVLLEKPGIDTQTEALPESSASPVSAVEPTPPEVVEEQAREAVPGPVAETTTVSEPPAAEEPSWVTGARRYHRAHAAIVRDFFANTGNACRDEATGEPDPYLVAHWQVEHGVKPDGRIGENTITASIFAIPEAASSPEPTPGEG
jgi:hypothetical protein